MKKKERAGNIILIILAVIVCGALFWSANQALSRHDKPTELTWVVYKVPEDMYLWELAAELADKFNKDPQALVRLISEKNRIENDFFLKKGDVIGIPQPK